VIREANGTLYGTASNGGASGAGVVFDLGTSGQLKVLYSFSGGNDGGSPDAGVTRDPFGNLFGTTNNGGTANVGVVFKLDKAGHETVLHTFVRGAEGNQPYLAGVIIDPESNLYGTTSFSGAGGGGTVYKVDPAGHASVVYAFPGNEGGQYPYNAGVFLGPEGRLYGTTFYGGRNGAGVVYELDAARTEHTLYSLDLFMTAGFGQPTGTLIRDSSGNLYGTTFIGQTNAGFGFGVVYKVDAAGHAKVLHNFTGGADGGDPYGGVVLDSAGNLYGTAIEGGSANSGVVFEIDTSGEGVVFRVDPAGHETVLYSFTGGADGGYPLGGLVADGAGNLYGVTGGGGSAAGAGVVFQLDSSGHETVLYTFTGGDDGGYPSWVTLARDSAGNLFGTTSGGGSYDEGVVFKVDPSGRETVLHTFTGGDDGGVPLAGVILGREGRLYGTTAFGGLENVGVVFEIKP
jgi:uncharacterized repeat protein (TIGR03803 family)